MRKIFIVFGAALALMLAASSQASAASTTCNTTLTGQAITGDLVVPADGSCTIVNTTVSRDVRVGENAYFQATGSQIGDDVLAYGALTVFIDTGTQVGGDVKASKTAQALVFNSAIGDDVEISRATDQVNVCGNTVEGDVAVKDSGPDILIGDPLAVGCNGNTVGDDVEVVHNFTDVEFVVRGNTVSDDMRILSNKGPVEKFVQDNQGGDVLSCFGNEQPFTASGNAGWNKQTGQCAIPPTECNTTLTGQNVPGDLVVPDGGSCTIVNTTVGGHVKVGRDAYFQSTGSTIAGDVRADRALTLFVDTGTTVGGDVSAKRTFQVFLFSATLNGDVDVSRTTDRVQSCGNSIDGDVDVEDSGRQILFGDPAGGCAANTVRNAHSAKFEDNFTDDYFAVRGNTFEGGDLEVSDNDGPSDKFVQDNTGGDKLECSGNQTPFTGTPNSFTNEQGQCAEI